MGTLKLRFLGRRGLRVERQREGAWGEELYFKLAAAF